MNQCEFHCSERITLIEHGKTLTLVWHWGKNCGIDNEIDIDKGLEKVLTLTLVLNRTQKKALVLTLTLIKVSWNNWHWHWLLDIDIAHVWAGLWLCVICHLNWNYFHYKNMKLFSLPKFEILFMTKIWNCFHFKNLKIIFTTNIWN